MKSRLNFPILAAKFAECLRDDRGQALTEYTILTTATMPAIFYLFHPDNGLFQAARHRYDLTTTLLMFPGP